MKVMVMVKATSDSEAGVMPSEQLLMEMGQYNEALVKAGIMLAGEGLHPSSKGLRVRFSGTDRSVTDGPFAETKELIAGYAALTPCPETPKSKSVKSLPPRTLAKPSPLN
jgi:hypothetical protein